MENKSKKKKDVCAVHGAFNNGSLRGICRHSGVSVNGGATYCHAHGNKKCQHRIKPEEL